MGDKPVYDEKLLLKAMISGDEKAFEALYRLYSPSIYRFILSYVNSRSFAEDIFQEVFLKVWEHREQLSDVRSFKSYLFIAARNHTINSLKAAFRSEIAMGEVLTHFLSQRSNPEEELLQKEYQQFLKRVLDTLPARTREVFILCREQRKSYKEAASALGISRNAIKNHMVSSMKVLRSSVEKDLGISLSLFLSVLLPF